MGNSEFKCECNEGFDGTRCEYKCPLECKENETCTAEINKATLIKGWNCIDLCEGIDCGNGTCIGGNCSCDKHFVNIGNVCRKTCALQPCQASNKFIFKLAWNHSKL